MTTNTGSRSSLSTVAGATLAIAAVVAPIDAADLDRAKLVKQLIRHEGKELKGYKDLVGILTVGVGFNLERGDSKKRLQALGLDLRKVKEGKQTLSEKQILKLLNDDIDIAIAGCKKVFPKYGNLSDVRQRVLADMMFNLGRPRLEGFKKMIAAVNVGNFAKAAVEMKDSKWYKQVGKRGQRLEAMMRTNLDQK